MVAYKPSRVGRANLWLSAKVAENDLLQFRNTELAAETAGLRDSVIGAAKGAVPAQFGGDARYI